MRVYSKERGYLQTNIAGEKVWLHFGMTALRILQDEFNLTLSELGHRLQDEEVFERIGAMGDLIYCGRKSYDEQHGNDIKYTRASCFEDVLDMEEDDITGFMAALSYMNGLDYIRRNPKKAKLVKSQLAKNVSTS